MVPTHSVPKYVLCGAIGYHETGDKLVRNQSDRMYKLLAAVDKQNETVPSWVELMSIQNNVNSTLALAYNNFRATAIDHLKENVTPASPGGLELTQREMGEKTRSKVGVCFSPLPSSKSVPTREFDQQVMQSEPALFAALKKWKEDLDKLKNSSSHVWDDEEELTSSGSETQAVRKPGRPKATAKLAGARDDLKAAKSETKEIGAELKKYKRLLSESNSAGPSPREKELERELAIIRTDLEQAKGNAAIAELNIRHVQSTHDHTVAENKRQAKDLRELQAAHNALGLQEARASAKLEMYQQGEGGRSRSHKRSRSRGSGHRGRESTHRTDSDE